MRVALFHFGGLDLGALSRSPLGKQESLPCRLPAGPRVPPISSTSPPGASLQIWWSATASGSNVHSGEIIAGMDVAIIAGRFAAIAADLSHAIGPRTQVIDAAGRYMVPGLCDGHMHVESGMVTVTEFARAVIPHGTTSMFIDPHEIANVLGGQGRAADA